MVPFQCIKIYTKYSHGTKKILHKGEIWAVCFECLINVSPYSMQCCIQLSWWRNQMEAFSALLALVRGIHRSLVNSPHKGQWRGALMFSLICAFISYLGMKSWDLHVCDRASTITHVDRVKKSNPWYNKIWLCLNVTIWSSQICFSVIFIHFVMIKTSEKKLHLFTLFSITRHYFSLFLVSPSLPP